MVSATSALISGSLVFAAVAVLLGLALRRGRELLPLDRPNERSLHGRPTPRIGGMAMMVVLLPVSLAIVPDAAIWVMPMALLALISAVDDFRGLPVALRFAVQGLAAAWGVYALLGDASVLVWVLGWAAIVWMTNLYNFMDGADGLAGGMALFGFGAYAAAAWLAGDDRLGASSMLICVAAGAFLLFNFHPARVFMGDAGSVPLGFAAAALGAAGWAKGYWPILFPVLVFSPFIADATVTLLRRLLRGERVWQAHKSHYYQRLVLSGVGHRNTALAEYSLMATVAVLAVWALDAQRLGWVAGAWTVLLTLFAVLVDRRSPLVADNPRGL